MHLNFRLFARPKPETPAPAPAAPAAEEPVPYASQWEYLDDWFTLVSGALDSAGGSDRASRAKPKPLEEMERRTAATHRAGVPLPFDSFVREHRLDGIDRLLLLSLLYDALNAASLGGVPAGPLFAACGADSMTERADVMRRLEERGALRAHDLVECDLDAVPAERYYRLARWCRSVLIPPADDAGARPATEADLLDRFDEAIGRLVRRVAGIYDPTQPHWCAPSPLGPGWSKYRAQAWTANRAVDELRAHGAGPLARTLNDLSFSRKEEAVLAILLYDARRSTTGLTVGFILSFVEKYAGARATWERLTGPGSALTSSGLIETAESGPLLFRRVRLTEDALHRLLPGIRFSQLNEPGANAQEEPKPFERIRPRVGLDEAILAPETRDELTELLLNAQAGAGFREECGLRSPAHVGNGTVLLFEGPPGTGKTFTAEAVAHFLGRPLFRACFDQLLSKWVGQTEKAITRLFREAQKEGAVVVVDEADAFLGARDGASQSYEIGHVNVLLQELERFGGLAILTTNRADALDPALERRLAARLTFKAPGPAERAAIWRWNMPSKAPVSKEIDFEELGRAWDFTGSQIRTASLRAALTAYRRGGSERVLTQRDLESAARHVSRGKTAVPVGFRAQEPAPGPGRLPRPLPAVPMPGDLDPDGPVN